MTRENWILLLMLLALTAILAVAVYLIVQAMTLAPPPEATPTVDVTGAVALGG